MHPLNPNRSAQPQLKVTQVHWQSVHDHCEAIADFMELHDGDAASSQAFREAAATLRQIPTEEQNGMTLEALEAVLNQHPGLPSATQLADIADQLKSGVPSSLHELLSLPGLGPKRLHVIWKELGIEDAATLHHAVTENRLLHQKGFGTKTQEKILQSLQTFRCLKGVFSISDLAPVAARLEGELRELLGKSAKFDLIGDFRRGLPECKAIEFLAEPDHYKAIMLHLIRTADYELMTASADMLLGRLRGTEIPFVFQFQAVNYFLELFKRSGSAAHVDLIPVDQRHVYASEAEIYEEAGLPWMPPELREGKEEVKLALGRKMPRLIEKEDVKGLLHVHTTYSDGSDRLEALAMRCREMGMQYLGVTDHGPGHQGKCMSLESIALQHREIDRLNQKLAPFKIFKGVEAEIHADGSLGMPDAVLASFDFVIASMHLNERISQADATIRLLKAIQNPHTTMIGHLEGRKVLGPQGQALELDLLIEACATYQVAVELNCHPSRMDLDWQWIRMAMAKSVQIGINPNAHSSQALDDYEIGLRLARKGMVSPAMAVNAQDLDSFQDWLSERRLGRLG